jgi:hypothetical protein
MASISQAQRELGSDFDFGGTERSGELKLGKVEAIMFEGANKFLKLAVARINARKKVDTGNLSDIVVSAVEKKGGKYSITIGYDKSNPASEYYDFQNKGVRGIKTKSPNSPYSYRTLSVSRKMVDAILRWYLRHKNYIRNEDQRKNLTPLQQKRKTLAQAVDPQKKLRQIATNTAKNIKKRGMPRIGFFDDNIPKAFGEDFQKKLATALGQDVALTIKNTFNGNNSTK